MDHHLEARTKIAELVDKFSRETNRAQSEADVRAGYIDLLFQALGWNIYNDPGHLTNYRREGYVRGAGYVDVGLEIRGQPVLFLEAKRFRLIPAFTERTGDRTVEEKQAFRYARGKRISYAILTNFERLHLFNADHERLLFAFDEPRHYLEHFEEFWRLSPEEVERGSLPWWEAQLAKRDVDLEFLGALRRWRILLANAIHQHNANNPVLQDNGSLDFDRLMAAVQRILARLILIRYGDDKEVLLEHDLLDKILTEYQGRGAYARSDHLMRAFIDLSHMMDEHHNTTLFAPGHICEQVALPNEALAQVIEDMNRISFRKFTSDILGNTYESYLGTKLVLRNGGIEDEERRDIRKGRGIYYTPRWVVEYIVDNTLGRRLRELEEEHGLRAIEQVRGLAVLDPACGSGSFLIYAYQVLADFYRRLNQAILDEQTSLVTALAAPDMFQRLERLQHLPQPVHDYPQVILREHLFGVDLDPEATEIAAVNLTMQAFADSRQRKLPLILNENIKWGNSLISGGEAELRPYFGDAWKEKRSFTWEEEFPEVMARGGFDVVIGNPPYLFGENVDTSAKTYFRDHYDLAKGQYDEYWLFYERCLHLLHPSGLHSYIVPDAVLVRDEVGALRSLLLKRTRLMKIGHAIDAFAHAVSGAIIVFRYQPASRLNEVAIDQISRNETRLLGQMSQDTFVAHPYNAFLVYVEPDWNIMKARLIGISAPLGTFVAISRGEEYGKGTLNDFSGEPPVGEVPVLVGEDISRYSPATPSHTLAEALVRKNKTNYQSPKLVIVKTGRTVVATLDTEHHYTLQSLYNLVFNRERTIHPKYVLGIVNSSLIATYIALEVTSYKRIFPQLNQRHVAELPIRRIDFDNPEQRAMHDHLVAQVERMLDLHQRLAAKGSVRDLEREHLEQEIAQTDRQIDDLVYDLYGLTDEERRLVEASNRSHPSLVRPLLGLS